MERTRTSRYPIGIVLLLVAAAVIPVLRARPAHAASNTTWSVDPASADGTTGKRSFFSYEVKPGDVITDHVKISNFSDQPIHFAVYGADAYNTAQGGFAVRLPDQPKRGLGAWVGLPFGDYSVPARTSATFPFELHVPANAEPGDIAGAIVATEDVPEITHGKGPGAVGLQRGVGARIYARVAGTLRPQLSVSALDASGSMPFAAPIGGTGNASVTYKVTNTGNVRLNATARATLQDLFGRTATTFRARNLPDLLPGGSATITQRADGLSLLGMKFTPHVDVTAAKATASASGSGFWAVPWLLVLVVVALVASGVVWLVRRRRRPPQPTPTPGPAPASAGAP